MMDKKPVCFPHFNPGLDKCQVCEASADCLSVRKQQATTTLEIVAKKLTDEGSYVDTEKVDGKICLDGFFSPKDLILLGVSLDFLDAKLGGESK